MSQGYTSDAKQKRLINRVLTDRKLGRLGTVASGLFTLGVLVLFAKIVQLADFGLFVDIIYPLFFNAYLLVLKIIVVTSILSIILGVFIGFMRVSRRRFTKGFAKAYVEFFRGTPLLFQLVLIYYGVPVFWQNQPFPLQNWGVPAAMIGMTLNHAAYIGEAIRGGIDSIPDGQTEGARSLGLSYTQSMRKVILPQAWRNSLAAIGNDQRILVKDTALLTIIAVPELISAFRKVNAATFDPWTPLILVAMCYLSITLPLGKIIERLEERAAWSETNT